MDGMIRKYRQHIYSVGRTDKSNKITHKDFIV